MDTPIDISQAIIVAAFIQGIIGLIIIALLIQLIRMVYSIKFHDRVLDRVFARSDEPRSLDEELMLSEHKITALQSVLKFIRNV